MTYQRVIPRDLFNEASLLKCWGRLVLLLGDGPEDHKAEIDHISPGQFEVEQDPADGAIFLGNMTLAIRGEGVTIYRPLNSREPWPLWCGPSSMSEFFEDVPVFDDLGYLSPEFRQMIGLAAKVAA